MSEKFSNTVLLIHFNHGQHFDGNFNLLEALYKPYFKKVLYYVSGDHHTKPNDNYIVTESRGGFTGYRAVLDFMSTNKSLMDDSDGLLYLMDDVFLNVNILKSMDPNRIIYHREHYFVNYRKLSEYNDTEYWRVWARESGRKACLNSINDSRNKWFEDRDFFANISDMFYLPSRFITDELIKAFDIMANYGVHLEIAVPTVMRKFFKTDDFQNFNCQPHVDVNRPAGVADLLNNNLYVHRVKLSDKRNIDALKINKFL